MQALKEDSARKTAEAERAPLQQVLDLEAQHQHYQRLIAQEEEALVSQTRANPGANPPEPSGSQTLANQEEARTTKLLQTIQRAQEKSSKSLVLSEGFQGSLTWLPESLGHLTELTELDISGQQLQVRRRLGTWNHKCTSSKSAQDKLLKSRKPSFCTYFVHCCGISLLGSPLLQLLQKGFGGDDFCLVFVPKCAGTTN